MDKQNTKNLTLFAITWPIFIELLLHMLMGNADTLMLSQYSDNAVAAVGVGNQILSVVIVMFGFVAQGAAVLIAQNIGAEKPKTAGQIALNALSMNLIFSLVLSIALFIWAEPILALMDLPHELMDEGLAYMQIVGGLIFVQALIMTTGAILRSYGYTKDTMVVTIIMNIINVIGNYFVIFGPFGFPILGVEGVAYSTAISRFIGFIALVILLVKRTRGDLNFANLFRYEKNHVKSLLKIGVPSAGEQLSYNASQMVITYFVAQLGTIAITTKVYTQNIMMFIFLFSVAIGQGTQILIGHMIGAGKIEDAYVRALKSLRISIFISLATAGVIYLVAKPFLGIFTDNGSIIEAGTVLLLMTVVLEPGRAFNLIMISSLRSAGDVKFPVYIGILVMWGISVTFAWFFGIFLGLGLIGIWIGFIADEWLRGVLMLRRWKQRNWVRMSFVDKTNS
ncbi:MULTISPECIES: MATE family efflux transporter [Ornithinibacillus]|uniref:MATE family efflux transporter n=2 Tax=Ornithinibacillus TaxID=484508 RepID=A0A923L2Z7_9BACI|nr:MULTISPECIES: MATE family efflux transporter [Ornithinibacillus]MBC5635529.1 MATE family efflux transporter [Ornithinibacillus hominis]MBS3679139.1 MATE family efflux transporter [Ornithinibacillus massiliensis]